MYLAVPVCAVPVFVHLQCALGVCERVCACAVLSLLRYGVVAVESRDVVLLLLVLLLLL